LDSTGRRAKFRKYNPKKQGLGERPSLPVIILAGKNHEKEDLLLAKRLVPSDKYFTLGICVSDKKPELIFNNGTYIYTADAIFAQ